jgi:hypothetical protein
LLATVAAMLEMILTVVATGSRSQSRTRGGFPVMIHEISGIRVLCSPKSLIRKLELRLTSFLVILRWDNSKVPTIEKTE